MALFRTADRLGAGRFPAYMPEDRSDRILAQKQERFTENTLVGPNELTRHLREVHAEGYARTLWELEDGLNAVGAPIYGPKHALLGAVSISGPAFGVPDETASEIVGPPKEAATAVSRYPGYDAAD